MADLAPITNVAHTIQVAVAPVFLLAGIGGFLNVCAGRLARVVDRSRQVEPLLLNSRGSDHDRFVDELRTLDTRIRIVNACISLSVLSACLTCLVVMLLFASQLFDVRMDKVVGLMFIVSMASLGIAFALFLWETRLGSSVVRIRDELLSHQSQE